MLGGCYNKTRCLGLFFALESPLGMPISAFKLFAFACNVSLFWHKGVQTTALELVVRVVHEHENT